MGMKKTSGMMSMLMMGAMLSSTSFGKEETFPPITPKKKKEIEKEYIKLQEERGMKSFIFGEHIVYALSKKRAIIKAKKKGYI